MPASTMVILEHDIIYTSHTDNVWHANTYMYTWC